MAKKKDPEQDIKRRKTAIENAKRELENLPTSGHEDQIIGAKAIEVGLRLAVQLAIVGLHQLCNSYNDISLLLKKKGYKVSGQHLSKLAQGNIHTPNSSILPVLLQVYRQSSTVLWKAWQAVTL